MFQQEGGAIGGFELNNSGVVASAASSPFVQFDKTGAATCPCGGGPTGVS